MGNLFHRFGIVVAVFLILPGGARAACSSTTDFGQLTASCAGGTAYCYVVSPGFDTPGSIAAAFWSLHGGNAVAGAGIDNGSWAAPGAWLFPDPLGNWLGGSWSDAPGIDGCISGQIPPGKPAEIMVTGLSDADAFGINGYFAIVSVARHASHFPQFDFAGGVGQNIELKPIPRTHTPSFTTISPGAWRASISSPSTGEVAAGFYTDGSTTVGEVVAGYRIYKQEPMNGRPPTDRHRSAWTPVTGVMPLGQTTSFNYLCLGQLTTYYATSLVFDSGYETSYVSSNGLPVTLCRDCPDDLDGDGWADGDVCGYDDCNDDDPSIYPGAPEVNDGKDNQCLSSPGYGLVDEISGQAGFYHPGDTTKFTWLSQDGASGYDVARSSHRDFSTDCLAVTSALPYLRDADTPPAGGVFYYLVRAAAPHPGSWGAGSSGAERAIACTPAVELGQKDQRISLF